MRESSCSVNELMDGQAGRKPKRKSNHKAHSRYTGHSLIGYLLSLLHCYQITTDSDHYPAERDYRAADQVRHVFSSKHTRTGIRYPYKALDGFPVHRKIIQNFIHDVKMVSTNYWIF